MTLLRPISAVLLSGCASAALAGQVVTLRVPVTLHGLHPEIAKLVVGCYITPAGAYNRTEVPVVQRAFNGTVEVKVEVTDAQSQSATGDKCKLALHPVAGAGWTPAQGSNAPPQAQAKPGSWFKVHVEGPLPPAGNDVVASPSTPVIVPGAPVQKSGSPAWGALGGSPPSAAGLNASGATRSRGAMSSSLPPPGN